MFLEFTTKIVSIVILLLIFFFFNKSTQLSNSKRSEIYFWIIIFILFYIMNYYGFLDNYSLYIIVLIAYLFLNESKDLLKVLIFILIYNVLFVKHYILLLIYQGFIILIYFLGKNKILFKYKLILVYLLLIILLNLEMYFIDTLSIYCYLHSFMYASIWLLFIIFAYYKQKTDIKINNMKIKFIDPDTKVKNYYYLLQRSYQLLKNKNNHISIILVNIDRLNDINSLYGKNYGDKAIKMVAQNIKDKTKGYGEVYRLDGNTFCVVALNENFKIMKIIAEKIKLGFEIKTSLIDNNKIKLTVSIGGYYGKITSKNIDDYIEIAHDLMIKSKFEGRNTAILNNNMVSYHKIM